MCFEWIFPRSPILALIKFIKNILFFTTGDQSYEEKTVASVGTSKLCTNRHAWTGNFTYFWPNFWPNFKPSARTANKRLVLTHLYSYSVYSVIKTAFVSYKMNV